MPEISKEPNYTCSVGLIIYGVGWRVFLEYTAHLYFPLRKGERLIWKDGLTEEIKDVFINADSGEMEAEIERIQTDNPMDEFLRTYILNGWRITDLRIESGYHISRKEEK